MAIAAPITAPLAFHHALVGLRDLAGNDDTIDMLCDASAAALDAALVAPATHFGDVRMKLAAIMAEAGTGLVEVQDLAFIARDLDTLLGARH